MRKAPKRKKEILTLSRWFPFQNIILCKKIIENQTLNWDKKGTRHYHKNPLRYLEKIIANL